MKRVCKMLMLTTVFLLTVNVCASDLNARYDGKQDVREWQNDARKKLIKLIGYDRILKKNGACDFAPKSIWKRKNAYGTIEKIRLQIDPEFASHIYLCIPDNVKPPYNVFICMQGHSTGMHMSIAVDWKDEKTPIKVAGDRDMAIGCMKRGIPVICFEQRAMGENSPHPKRGANCYRVGCMALTDGVTLIGYRVYDIKRLIDYIKSRPDMNSSKIGITGNSGGATTAMFAGAILPELTHVMPSSCFSSFRKSIYERRHCLCNYIPGLFDYGESAEVAGLIAPRHLVIINGKRDRSFPLDGANAEFKRIQQIYRGFNAEKNCQLLVGNQGHRFYADISWKAMLPYWNQK